MSEPFSAADVVEWCGGELAQGSPDTRLVGLSIDTRKVSANQIFVAVAGPNHDSHDYLDQAIEAGASALLVNASRRASLTLPSSTAVVAVRDTVRGLGDLAAGHRSHFSGHVVGMTGSSGKTTTKEMCAAVLSASQVCLKTEGNLNNDFGVPLTLMRREREHEVLVIEMGMNHRGEIARLAEIAQPTIGVITNIGTAHIEYLGSVDEIAEEKGDLFAALPEDGLAVANWDDPHVARQSKRCRGAVVRYGVHPEADVRAEEVRYDDAGHFEFRLILPEGTTDVRVSGLGETTIINALAAAAAGVACGLSVEEVQQGLAHYRPIGGRMTRHALQRGITLIDDSYNANPQSMRASLEALARLKGTQRGFAVLGAMGELGDRADEAHREAGRSVAKLGIDRLFVVGESAAAIFEGAREAGMSEDDVQSCADHDAATRLLRSALEPEDWIIVKGSRAARMERIVESLMEEEEE